MTIINWHNIRQRLEAAHAAAQRTSAADPADVKSLLKARARALAIEPEQERATETLEIVEFRLAHETYAVDAGYVREVYPLENFTALPCTPAFVLGIMNVRGEILSVIDIRKFFGLPERGLTELNRVIVLESDSMLVGVLADSILGVRRIPVTGIQPPLTTLTGIRAKYVKGLTRDRAVLLDAEGLLSDQTIIVDDQVEA